MQAVGIISRRHGVWNDLLVVEQRRLNVAIAEQSQVPPPVDGPPPVLPTAAQKTRKLGTSLVTHPWSVAVSRAIPLRPAANLLSFL